MKADVVALSFIIIGEFQSELVEREAKKEREFLGRKIDKLYDGEV